MGTVIGLAARRAVISLPEETAGFPAAPVVPEGCKGPACPAFALCQGRCAVSRGNETELGVLAPGAR